MNFCPFEDVVGVYAPVPIGFVGGMGSFADVDTLGAGADVYTTGDVYTGADVATTAGLGITVNVAATITMFEEPAAPAEFVGTMGMVVVEMMDVEVESCL